MEEKGNHVARKKGGLVTMPFIFANEICEKLAVVGFNANMISYLTTQVNMPLTKAANTLTNFGGTASLTPLLGAFLADAYAGRFWTITIACIIYQIGMISLTVSAILPQLRPPPCQHNQVCKEADGDSLQFLLVYIQDNIGWGLGLGIPTIAMFISIIIFIAGYPLYRNLDPAGSPFTRLIQVSVAAYKKRKLPLVSDDRLLYQNDELDAPISLGGKLLHTKHMKFLDKAAIVTEEDNLKLPNLWRLNTVHRVEELKSVH
ncbi:protein NRT1/ PTR FAMILY 3.1 [Prunus yedoensis var. nudiflora]|uniref:Protein NRT1/ PTR FAMILY 3.1 n=1 Tax=Prunus yedoensis var. nudiflora TaxID=2094558 RepID=A0A314YY13_PRUYE|nr:protein NRT1/ PTR FAMILY 3.1 [Prunus yedoensis var. nudiflora]